MKPVNHLFLFRCIMDIRNRKINDKIIDNLQNMSKFKVMFDINGRAVIDQLKKHSSASLKGKKRPQKRQPSEISDDSTEEQGNPNKKSRLDNSKPNEESINQTKEEIEEKHDAKLSDKRQGSQESEVKHGAKGTIEIRDIKQRSGTRKNQQDSGKAAIDLDNVEEREDPYLDTYWIEELGLKVRDKYIIQRGYWINDRIIDAASFEVNV